MTLLLILTSQNQIRRCLLPSRLRKFLLAESQSNMENSEVDWVKDTAIVVTAFTGIEKMFKVYRLWKAASHGQTAAVGLTVKNGEYASLVKTLGRIEGRIDHLGRDMKTGNEALSARIEAVEVRLST